MALLPRLIMTPNFFRSSRENVDVTKPLTTTSEHLTFNSDWTRVERLHNITLIRANSLSNPVSVLFAPLAVPPHAVIIRKALGTAFTLYDAIVHESQYFDKRFLIGGKYPSYSVLEERHFVDYTLTDRAVLKQQPTAFAFYNGTLRNEGNNYRPDKYDFVLLVFKYSD